MILKIKDIELEITQQEISALQGKQITIPLTFDEILESQNETRESNVVEFGSAKDVNSAVINKGDEVIISERETIPRNTDKEIRFDETLRGRKSTVLAFKAEGGSVQARILIHKETEAQQEMHIIVYAHWLEKIEEKKK